MRGADPVRSVLASLPDLGLRLDDDVVLLGTVPDGELPGWYAAADVLRGRASGDLRVGAVVAVALRPVR